MNLVFESAKVCKPFLEPLSPNWLIKLIMIRPKSSWKRNVASLHIVVPATQEQLYGYYELKIVTACKAYTVLVASQVPSVLPELIKPIAAKSSVAMSTCVVDQHCLASF